MYLTSKAAAFLSRSLAASSSNFCTRFVRLSNVSLTLFSNLSCKVISYTNIINVSALFLTEF